MLSNSIVPPAIEIPTMRSAGESACTSLHLYRQGGRQGGGGAVGEDREEGWGREVREGGERRKERGRRHEIDGGRDRQRQRGRECIFDQINTGGCNFNRMNIDGGVYLQADEHWGLQLQSDEHCGRGVSSIR